MLGVTFYELCERELGLPRLVHTQRHLRLPERYPFVILQFSGSEQQFRLLPGAASQRNFKQSLHDMLVMLSAEQSIVDILRDV
jgi:hypothetical protein